ncbi:Erlin-2 [Rhynchospora pubera]|uniref:Erlin-2 n=1 Tax=Rhynchospora pubera TaxID=906938 RepID=A0AAV8HGQ6_9POAL|nr:Erlin-2 [Rhynchospora pubera]KAJ4815421.1 Erlin-2 [Rhynchospora pubera]
MDTPPPPQQDQQQEELLRRLRSQVPQRSQQQPPPPGDLSAIGPIVLIVASFFFVVAFVSMTSSSGNFLVLHQVPEGHVGVYWRGGALMKTITDPGFHMMMPLVTKFEPIQVTLQTDLVRDIPCGTKGGVMISFDKIEVVNRLRKDYVYDTLLNYGIHYDKTWIYDKIHHEINQFCSAHSLQQVYIDMFDQIDDKMKEAIQRDCTQYAPGIEIISVRVTKPNIPSTIKRNFELMEEERTKALIAIEKQKVAEKEAETQKKIALSEAEKNSQVSRILMEQKLMEKDSAKRQEAIENEMFVAREKAQTDANFYRVMKEAEANKLKLTPEFLELKFIEAISNNTKIFFGDKVPNMIMDQRLLGSFLNGMKRKDFIDVQ